MAGLGRCSLARSRCGCLHAGCLVLQLAQPPAHHRHACLARPPPQVDPQVSASVYYAASLYYKQQKEYAPYYRWAGRHVGWPHCGWDMMSTGSSWCILMEAGLLHLCRPCVPSLPAWRANPHCRATLMHLAFVSQDTLPQDFRQVTGWDYMLIWLGMLGCSMPAALPVAMSPPALPPSLPPSMPPSCHLLRLSLQALAVDISLAAMLGDDVYNFGELLLHPIVSRWRAGDWVAAAPGPDASHADGWVQYTPAMRPARGVCASSSMPLHSPARLCAAPAPLQINALKEGGYGWLHDMLECFNSGEAVGQDTGSGVLLARRGTRRRCRLESGSMPLGLGGQQVLGCAYPASVQQLRALPPPPPTCRRHPPLRRAVHQALGHAERAAGAGGARAAAAREDHHPVPHGGAGVVGQELAFERTGWWHDRLCLALVWARCILTFVLSTLHCILPPATCAGGVLTHAHAGFPTAPTPPRSSSPPCHPTSAPLRCPPLRSAPSCRWTGWSSCS